MSASRRLAASQRSSPRAASARASPTASSAARATLSASASSVSASASRSAAARRSAVAVSISPISAWRCSANICGAFFSSLRSLSASSLRCPMVAIWAAALSLRSLQAARSAAIACRRRLVSSASRAIACASTRTSAHVLRSLAITSLTAASLASIAAAGGSAASAFSASPRATMVSSRLVLMRALASLSAEMRAALRLISRSAAACSSRAASV